MAGAPAHDSVLLLGFGGPTRRDEVRPFLDNVLRGKPVPRERLVHQAPEGFGQQSRPVEGRDDHADFRWVHASGHGLGGG